MYNIKELLTNPILLDVVTKKIFDAVDEDGSGRISEDELHAILGSLAEDFGFERPTVAETEEILSLIDVDRSGLIDFTEFKRVFIVDLARRTWVFREGGKSVTGVYILLTL